jgi:hypothetical protein
LSVRGSRNHRPGSRSLRDRIVWSSSTRVQV